LLNVSTKLEVSLLGNKFLLEIFYLGKLSENEYTKKDEQKQIIPWPKTAFIILYM